VSVAAARAAAQVVLVAEAAGAVAGSVVPPQAVSSADRIMTIRVNRLILRFIRALLSLAGAFIRAAFMLIRPITYLHALRYYNENEKSVYRAATLPRYAIQ
jgi:hypothetical protein